MVTTALAVTSDHKHGSLQHLALATLVRRKGVECSSFRMLAIPSEYSF